MTARHLLQLGCGGNQPSGWINTDSSLNIQIQSLPVFGPVARRFTSTAYERPNAVYQNLNRPWRYASGSMDVVYASHVFEHLTRPTARLFLSESWRVLRPGGALRLVVPDLYAATRAYVEAHEAGAADAAGDLLYVLNLHRDNIYNEGVGRLHRALGWLQRHPHQHKFMYDERSLSRLVEAKGFQQVRTSAYGVSEYIPEIRDVENTSEGIAAVYVEAIKP